MTSAPHAGRAHARFGASSAHRWFACPGSVRLCEDAPRRSSGAADEGTRAHELLEVMLRVHGSSDGAAHEQAAPQDMRDAVRVAYDFVTGILADHPDAVMLVEHAFEIPVAAAPGDVWGTCDVVIFVPSLRLLYVVDYKHGAGVHVAVRGNKQLRFYGLGALQVLVEKNKIRAHLTTDSAWTAQIDTVALVIVQPRCPVGDPVREEWLPVEDLIEFGKELGAAVTAAKAPDAPLVPGEEQCRFCAAALTCPAREQQAVDASGEAFAHVERVQVLGDAAPYRQMSNEALAKWLGSRELVTSWFAALDVEAETRMRAGGNVPDWKLVEAKARREWVDDSEATAFKLADVFQANGGCNGDVVDLFRVTKLRGLTEIEAAMKRGATREEARRRLDEMAYLTTKKSSGALKVAPESDPRPAVNRAAEAFAGVRQIGDS